MDPYVQMPDFTQNFNRYSYCLNNPLIYTDPDGEWIHIAIGAIVGGVINLVANTVGAGAGAATAATGGAAGAGAWAVVGVGAGAGAVTAGTNNVIAQTGKNFAGFNNVDWGQVGINSAIGGVSGAAGAGAGHAASGMKFLVNDISSPVLRSAIVSPLAAGAGHVAGGTTANLFQDQKFGDAFLNSFDGIWQNIAIGGAIGVASTIGTSYANRINPWNGKALNTSKNVSSTTSSAAQKVDALIGSATDMEILSNGTTQQGFVQGDAQAIFRNLTNGAQHIQGNLYKLPDGTYINFHNSTGTGIPTIDVNRGGVIYKIRVR